MRGRTDVEQLLLSLVREPETKLTVVEGLQWVMERGPAHPEISQRLTLYGEELRARQGFERRVAEENAESFVQNEILDGMLPGPRRCKTKEAQPGGRRCERIEGHPGVPQWCTDDVNWIEGPGGEPEVPESDVNVDG